MRRLFQLYEHPVRRRRVNERDQRPFGPRPGVLVDEPYTAHLEFGDNRLDVLDAERDVMQTRTTLLDKPRNR